jgi:hypothetical protein
MRISRLLMLTTVVMTMGIYYMNTRPNRNVRNNNPLNIRESASWEGEKSLDLDKSFEEFKTPEYGFRAAYIILLQYLERGDNTIAAITAKWAPSTENHTDKYVDYLADKMELSPSAELLPTDLPLIMLHMANYEGAQGAFNYAQINEGIALANQESFVIARLNRLALGYGNA